nr:DUF2169 domain-containing protein [Massilia sp. CCM 8734]
MCCSTQVPPSHRQGTATTRTGEKVAVINSVLPFPYLLFEKSGWRGIPLDVLVVRGTFDIGHDGRPMRVSSEQTPIRLGDEYQGPVGDDPLAAVLAHEGDLVVGKLATDVVVTGHLHSPHGKPAADWISAVRVGNLHKGMRVTGPREFRRTLFGWKVTKPAAVSTVPLDYHLAFGGRLRSLGQGDSSDVYFSRNSAGIGWLPGASDLKNLPSKRKRDAEKWQNAQRVLPAPQFEDYQQPITSPYQHVPPEGFGPIARWWEPRVSLQGTLDAAWQAERYPDPPDDYNPRFTQSAHPDLISSRLITGHEPVVLAHCFAEEKTVTALPSMTIHAMTVFSNGTKLVMPMALGV